MIIVEATKGSDESAPKFFNGVIKEYRKPGVVFGFLSEHDYLASTTCLDTIIDYLKRSVSGAAYADSYVVFNSDKLTQVRVPQILPSFSRETVNNIVINTPLFMAAEFVEPFDDTLESVYFYDLFRQLSKKMVVAHIPLPITYSRHPQVSAEELEKVRAKHG